MIAAWTRARSLVRQIDGFAPPRWRRDPAWWALIGATATLEARGRRAAGPYLISDGGPGADTFMGAPTPGPTDRAAWIAWAIAAAHAAVTAIDQLDGTLPDQPLAVTIARAGGAAHTRPAPDRRRVGFVLGDRVVSVGLDPRGPAHERALADRLAATLDGRGAIEAPGPPPLVAVTVGEVALTAAHHAHRRAWTAAGGPWLGIARTGGLTAVTTCHLAVDGFGHAALTRAILDGLTAGLAVAPRGPAGPPPPPAPAGVGEHLDVAWRALPSGGRALPLAYALARTLAARGIAAPILQLPVAPGAVDDPARFARRVRPAMLGLRRDPSGAVEPYPAFAERARRAIADEAASAGVASRMLDGLRGLPLPLAVQRRVLAGAPSRWLAGPSEALAGDACLSVLRATAPLVAASAPPPQLPRDRGTAVVTVIAHPEGALATAATVGPWPAAALLADLADAL